MHLPNIISLAPSILYLLAAAGRAAAGAVKVNYYSDGGCSAFMVSIWPFDTMSCYNWQWTGSNSANIAGCPTGGSCYCQFYQAANCQGGAHSAVQVPFGPSCASNWGYGFQSMRCNYFP